jgi:hypothetical protein
MASSLLFESTTRAPRPCCKLPCTMNVSPDNPSVPSSILALAPTTRQRHCRSPPCSQQFCRCRCRCHSPPSPAPSVSIVAPKNHPWQFLLPRPNTSWFVGIPIRNCGTPGRCRAPDVCYYSRVESITPRVCHGRLPHFQTPTLQNHVDMVDLYKHAPA